MQNHDHDLKGARKPVEEEIALINKIKNMGEELSLLVAMVSCHVAVQAEAIRTSAMKREFGYRARELEFEGTAPARWIAIAKTDLQTGLMALTRTVAQPTTF